MAVNSIGTSTGVTTSTTVGGTTGTTQPGGNASNTNQSGVGSLSQDFGATNWGGVATQDSGLQTSASPSTLSLTSAQRSELTAIGLGIKTSGASAALQSRWSNFIADMASQGGAVDANALVEAVLREAYLQNTEDLRFYAEKVKFFNELKKQIRTELTNARSVLAQNASNTNLSSAYTKQQFSVTFYGGAPTSSSGGSCTTKAQLEDYIKGLEEKLNSVGDDAQLANVDLQNMLQKQQQTLQMMSNISKMLNDTALAVIRKIGG